MVLRPDPVAPESHGSRFPCRSVSSLEKGSGQGSLEYLLLIAGGLLVVMIVLLIALALSPFGEQFFNTNLVEYEHIDLCSGRGADCSFTMDWGPGLLSPPYGMFLSNDSDWRTLAVTGVEVSLLCGTVPCDASVVVGAPSTSLEMPIATTGCTATSGNHVVCPYCDVAGPTPCYNTGSIPFCPSGGSGTCSTTFDFTGTPDSMMTLPPYPTSASPPLGSFTQKVAIGAARINSSFVTGLRYNFLVSRVNASNNLVDAGVNPSFSLSFHRAGTNVISEYACDLSSAPAAATAFSGCRHGPGCIVTPCSSNNPDALAYCNTLPTLPTYVCRTGPGSADFAPFNPSTCVFPAPFGTVELSPTRGGVIRSTLPNLSEGGQFVGSLPSGLVFSVRNGVTFEFQPTPVPGQCTFGAASDAAANDACRAACLSLAPQLNGLELYDLSSVSLDSPAICSALFSATPAQRIMVEDPTGGSGGSVALSGGCYSGSTACSPYCYADYRFSQMLTSNAALGRDSVVGFRLPGAVGIEMIGAYSGQFVPAVGGVYYAP